MRDRNLADWRTGCRRPPHGMRSTPVWDALDARKAGFAAYVIEDATRGIDAGGSLGKAWHDMTGAGVKRIMSSDIERS